MEKDWNNSFFGSFFGYFIRHSTIANLIMIGLIVFGVFSVNKLRSQFFPDVIIETINVTIKWPGTGGDDLDRGVVSFLEPNLLDLDGLDKIVSTSYEGVSRIQIDFETNWDMEKALEDVKLAVEETQNLPSELEEIDVNRRIWRDRVTNVVFSGPFSVDQLEKYSDEFLQMLYAQGISKTSIRGVNEPVVRVTVPESKLIKNGLTLRELSNSIKIGASSKPAGETSDGLARLKAGVEKTEELDLANITARTLSNGDNILLGDLGYIRTEIVPVNQFFQGKNPAIIMRVDRGQEGDAIGIQQKVEETILNNEPPIMFGVG